MSILDLLAGRPRESIGLSEIARRLSMNKATCHMVLTALAGNGYVLVDPETKTYSLGPASAALGRAALDRFPAIGYARDVARHLSEELGLLCMVMARAANQLLMLDGYGTPSPLGPFARVGNRAPFAPPLGVSLIAWATPAEYEEWLARATPPLAPAERAALEEAIAGVRADGFEVARRTRAEQALADLLQTSQGSPNHDVAAAVPEVARAVRLEPDSYIVTNIEDSETYRIAAIAAPLFGPEGLPVLSLVLEGFRWDIPGREIRDVGARLVEQARRASVESGGRPPMFRAEAADRATDRASTGGRAGPRSPVPPQAGQARSSDGHAGRAARPRGARAK
jgi:DNA-binding IclR family transcriptional regulator